AARPDVLQIKRFTPAEMPEHEVGHVAVGAQLFRGKGDGRTALGTVCEVADVAREHALEIWLLVGVVKDGNWRGPLVAGDRERAHIVPACAERRGEVRKLPGEVLVHE